MNASALHRHFPLAKGTMLFVGMLMVFAAIMLGIHMWYELRIEQIDHSIDLLSQ